MQKTFQIKTVQETSNPCETKMELAVELMRSYLPQFEDALAHDNSEAEYERQLKRYFQSVSFILFSR